MSYVPQYRKGDWKAVCDRCGFIYPASQLKKTWDGYRVCHEDWEPRHPQEFLRARKDDQTVPWTRPESESFVDTSAWATDFTLLWNRQTSGTSVFLRSIGYYNGTWVVCGDSGTILTSTDNGTTWTSRTSGVSNSLREVKNFEGTWYAVGFGTGASAPAIVSSTDDGVTWSSVTISGIPNGHFTGIGIKPSPSPLMIIMGYEVAAAGIIVSTADGSTWNVQTPPSAMRWGYGAHYNDGVWMIVGGHTPFPTPYIGTSTTGTSWTDRVGPANPGEAELWTINHDGNNWLITEVYGIQDGVNDYTKVWRSSEVTPTVGADWTSATPSDLATQWSWRTTTNGTRWMICGGLLDFAPGNGRIVTSLDNGVTWTTSYAIDSINHVSRAEYAESNWIAVGDDGLIIRSSMAATGVPAGTFDTSTL